MKPVSAYVNQQYTKIFKYTSVHACRKSLVENDALAVFEDDENSFIGILTPKDVIERPHILVADCLKQRTPVEPESPVNKVLESMHTQNINVLPVVSGSNILQGLIYKKDLMKAVWDKKEHLTTALYDSAKKMEELSASSALLAEAQSNIDDLQLLVSPEGNIIFHNREVDQYMLNQYQRLLSSADKIDALFGDYFGINAEGFTQMFTITLDGEPSSIETEAINNNEAQSAARKTFKTLCRPVRIQEELKGVAITITDITRQKTKDQLFLEQKSALKAAMFTESHIIRRPLSNILALIELFDKSTLTGQNTEVLDLLKVSAEELDGSIKNSTQMIYSTYSKLA